MRTESRRASLLASHHISIIQDGILGSFDPEGRDSLGVQELRVGIHDSENSLMEALDDLVSRSILIMARRDGASVYTLTPKGLALWNKRMLEEKEVSV